MDEDCEGCGDTATREDAAGVPLCEACYLEMSCDDLTKKLAAAQARIRELEADVLRHEEREASVCPEDVGCDEMIRHLQSRISELEAKQAEWWDRWLTAAEHCNRWRAEALAARDLLSRTGAARFGSFSSDADRYAAARAENGEGLCGDVVMDSSPQTAHSVSGLESSSARTT